MAKWSVGREPGAGRNRDGADALGTARPRLLGTFQAGAPCPARPGSHPWVGPPGAQEEGKSPHTVRRSIHLLQERARGRGADQALLRTEYPPPCRRHRRAQRGGRAGWTHRPLTVFSGVVRRLCGDHRDGRAGLVADAVTTRLPKSSGK